jgi:hypothetical protein
MNYTNDIECVDRQGRVWLVSHRPGQLRCLAKQLKIHNRIYSRSTVEEVEGEVIESVKEIVRRYSDQLEQVHGCADLQTAGYAVYVRRLRKEQGYLYADFLVDPAVLFWEPANG